MLLSAQIDKSKALMMQGQSIPWLLDQWVQRCPDKTFLVWEPFSGEPTSYSFQRLQQETRQIAGSLYEKGVRPGDFVIIHMENSPEFILSWFACAALGAVAVSTNTHSVARDLEYFADHTAAVCALTQPAFAGMIVGACQNLKFVAVTDNDAGEAPTTEIPDQCISFNSLLAGNAAMLPERVTDPMDNLSVQFTSGTTSRPKAVLWTHANGLWAGKASAIHMRLNHDDKTLIFMPLFHTNAQGYSMLASLWVGATIVVQPKFSASRFWPLSLKYKLTWLSTIPFAFKAIAGQPVPEHQYRFWGTAAHIPALKDAFKVDTIGWWGMTETLTHGIVTDVDHPGPAGSIGRVAPEYEIQIRTGEGKLAGPGERGLLFIRGVRGVSLFKEYYRNDEANQQAFDENGWFDTGDIIRMDENGYLFFSDRDKDMLKVGAENVAASEIESVVMQTGLVSECAVVGQKHHMLDEVPVAFVILAPGVDAGDGVAEKIIGYCETNLASFKVPKAVHIVDALPRSTLEKIAKNELRKTLAPITAN